LSACLKRLIFWLILAGFSIAAGIITDLVLNTGPFPLSIRLPGLIGMLLAHFPLKRTGKILGRLGKPEKWGCTTRFITKDIYKCVRHPHHLGVGIFMTSLGLLIGYPWSFFIITISQWIWVIAFLLMVEEPELKEKFGKDYNEYSRNAPMLFPKPICVLKVLTGSNLL